MYNRINKNDNKTNNDIIYDQGIGIYHKNKSPWII